MNRMLLQIRRYVAIAFGILFMVAAARVIWVAWASDATIGRIILALALSIFALGVITENAAALRATAAICLLAAIAMPVGIFNPFAVGDHLAAGEQPPSFPGALLWLIPLEIFLLASAYVLDLPSGTSQSKQQPGRVDT